MRKFLVIGLFILSLTGLTACENESSPSTTRVIANKSQQHSKFSPVYNKRFRIPTKTFGITKTDSDNNKLTGEADAWIAKQDLNKYYPHISIYPYVSTQGEEYIYEDVTMTMKK